MTIDFARCRRYLKEFDFDKLFREELGWDRHNHKLEAPIDGHVFILSAVAQKRGFAVYLCPPGDDGLIPDYSTRRKIDRLVGKSAYEHLIIFTDRQRATQIWQWVKRERGRPDACREHIYHNSQSGDAMLQKLQAIAFDFAEEEELTIAHVAARVQQGFYADRVTKKFYDRFKKEHETFLKFIKGVKSQADAEWYASLTLNRLMFVYFIQKKGFLDGDHDYLRNRMKMMQERKGKDKFLSFYRHFLLRLFHEGLGQPSRNAELDALLGRVPYLNGGLFDVHQLESENPNIEIPDKAFERIFDFFDAYRWHLDERPLRADNEINPDVLGYIFEKYINQKQMGAYYTKEDITEYIGKNTIIPFLFDAAEKKCAIAFKPGSAVWRLLSENPDRYIYEAVRKGVDLPLPADIEAGLDDVSKRDGWNRPAAPEYALPTETWREHVARRRRCHELRAKLSAGEIRSINDLVTYNLDIRQFAQDVIENCEGPEPLRAFYYTMAGRVPKRSNEKYEAGMSVLDPTCGSGAFLFAALNILEPLYEACLERMEGFVAELERASEKRRPEKFADFRDTLAEVARHPNRRYFILKTIILNNLFGVDIMEEAVEICKLRLFLKLVAQVERLEEIEPLPDIDFNVRAGNTLVGFANYGEAQKAVTSKLQFDDAMSRIDESAEIADRAFKRFREMQTAREMDAQQFTESKQELRRRLKELNDELDRYLAGEYGVNPDKAKDFEKWRASHQPFHWFVEFYGIIKNGGFDVIIGNPPYVELSAVRSSYRPLNFKTEHCGNLYALCLERCVNIQKNRSWLGLVVQQPFVSTQRMQIARDILSQNSSLILSSTYDDRPSKLFDGIHHARIAIVLMQKAHNADASALFATSYNKWYKEERPILFQRLAYAKSSQYSPIGYFPKIGSDVEASLLEKLLSRTNYLATWIHNQETAHKIYYKITGVGHWFTITARPPRFLRDGKESSSTREHFICFASKAIRDRALALLNSSLFYWFYQVRTNCRDFNPSDYRTFPIALSLESENLSSFSTLLQKALDESSDFISVSHSKTGAIQVEQFKPRESKLIIDEIDRVLAKHYGFTDEELDFIINYDIKYRMGRDGGEEEE